MKHPLALLAALALPLSSLPLSAQAFTGDVGEIAVIEDTTGAIHDTTGFWSPGQICQQSAKVFYTCHGDDYDVLVSFTTQSLSIVHNVQYGQPVRNSEKGFGDWILDYTAQYGSAGQLQHCVSMQDLAQLPDDPDAVATFLGFVPAPVTGVELMGHELGHHWLNSAVYDKNDGNGQVFALRGDDGDRADPNPNLHYAQWVNSHSVMYGSFITPQANGSFLACGGDRKYNQLDQYFMGLRGPDEVAPISFVDDGTLVGNPGSGQTQGVCDTLSGATHSWVDVDIQDIIRVMGARVPSVATSQKHWKLGFMLSTPAGQPPTPTQIAKVDAYRQRFEEWFTWATDGRGSVSTTLVPSTLCAGTPDAGTDAGTPDAGVDAGTPDAGADAGVDAGTDAGTDAGADGGSDAGVDAGTPDAGADGGTSDGGQDGGNLCDLVDCDGGSDAGDPDLDTIDVGGGCCSQAGGAGQGLYALLMGTLFLLRRRRCRGPLA